jgi:hypothetical protein
LNGFSTPVPGGVGLVSTIITTAVANTYAVGQVSNSSVYFAGGGSTGVPATPGGLGGGGASSPTPSGSSGTANTGGGAGTNASGGAAGGSGVVIIADPDSFAGATVTGTVSSSTSGNTQVYIFTGSGTISF